MLAQGLGRIRVLELASYIAGPYAGALLGDLGAEVIKVEAPGQGDPFRGWAEGNYSPMYCSVNRNKKSVTIDLHTDEGREQLLGLVDTADVLIENYRTGVAERLGFGYAAMHARNPRLVYCSITGFGVDGPYAHRPGYDTVGQAMSGLLSLLTDLDNPQPMGISLSDHITGLYACYGILGALLMRETSGRGQRVDTSLLQATVAFMSENVTQHLVSGVVPERSTRVRLAQVYAFRAGDGKPFVLHLSSPNKFWLGLLRAIDREAWADDPRYANVPARRIHYDALHGALAEVFATAPRAAWLERLGAQDVPSGPLNTLEEVFLDPQVMHLALRTRVHHPEKGAVDMVRSGVNFSDTPASITLPPPVLGEHTRELLGSEPDA